PSQGGSAGSNPVGATQFEDLRFAGGLRRSVGWQLLPSGNPVTRSTSHGWRVSLITPRLSWSVSYETAGHSVPLRRSTSLSRSAAAITAGACSRPGCRESRSIGPETDTEAITLPEGLRTGADTEATPASRSATDWAQPRRRTAANDTAL